MIQGPGSRESSRKGYGPEPPDLEPETTYRLLEQAGAGDSAALDALCRRYLPRLRRWAAGRLPAASRDMIETDDLVQEVLASATRHVKTFEYRQERAFQAYVRKALHNRVLQEIERTRARPEVRGVSINHRSTEASPLEELVGSETLSRYERALESLDPMERDAIVGRLELRLSYADLAESLGKPTPDAARKHVSRALLKLASEMSRDE